MEREKKELNGKIEGSGEKKMNLNMPLLISVALLLAAVGAVTVLIKYVEYIRRKEWERRKQEYGGKRERRRKI